MICLYVIFILRAINKRRTRYIVNSTDPEWNKTVDYQLSYHQIPNYYLEFTVWDYGKGDNICLGQVIVSLSGMKFFYDTIGNNSPFFQTSHY